MAFLIAPLGAVAVYAALLVLDPIDGPSPWRDSLLLLGAIAVTTYMADLLLALPAWTVCMRLRWTGSFPCIVGGWAIGLAVGLLFDLPGVNLHRWRPYATSGAAGVVSGVVFVFVLNRGSAAEG
jgi:hypothetical protein